MKYLLSAALFPALLLAEEHCRGIPSSGTRVNVRYPPTIQADDCWEAPPYAWNFGHWYPSYTSFPPYLSLYNFQNEIYPKFPTTQQEADLRQNLDLASYNIAPTGNSTLDDQIYIAFGLDTPSPEIGPMVFNFTGQGNWHLTNYYIYIAWGYDTEGDGYFVEYETPVDPTGNGDIAIVSRKKGGPSPATTRAIFHALNTTFAGETRGSLGDHAKGLQKLKTDGRRDGKGVVACDAACMDNAWMAGL
jgi:hypothetical protein